MRCRNNNNNNNNNNLSYWNPSGMKPVLQKQTQARVTFSDE